MELRRGDIVTGVKDDKSILFEEVKVHQVSTSGQTAWLNVCGTGGWVVKRREDGSWGSNGNEGVLIKVGGELETKEGFQVGDYVIHHNSKLAFESEFEGIITEISLECCNIKVIRSSLKKVGSLHPERFDEGHLTLLFRKGDRVAITKENSPYFGEISKIGLIKYSKDNPRKCFYLEGLHTRYVYSSKDIGIIEPHSSRQLKVKHVFDAGIKKGVQIMNKTVKKLYGKTTLENALLVQKHLGGYIAEDPITQILLEDKKDQIMAKAKELEKAEQKAAKTS